MATKNNSPPLRVDLTGTLQCVSFRLNWGSVPKMMHHARHQEYSINGMVLS